MTAYVGVNSDDYVLPVSVDWTTFDWTATAGEDYVAASGTLTFEANESRPYREIPITIESHSGYSLAPVVRD